jgi:hypothetical protein
VIKDVEGGAPRARIRTCSVSDPYVLILREDDTIGLFVAADTKKIRRKDMSPMGDKVLSSQYVQVIKLIMRRPRGTSREASSQTLLACLWSTSWLQRTEKRRKHQRSHCNLLSTRRETSF